MILRVLLAFCYMLMGSRLCAAVDVESNPKFDFACSELVLIGRVVGVSLHQEVDATAQQQGTSYFGYYAQVKALRVFKGPALSISTINIPIGGYWAKATDGEASIEPLLRNGGLNALEIGVGKVYLLFLNRTPDTPDHVATWSPRSQHSSLIPIWKSKNRLIVMLPNDQKIGLDEYTADMQRSAEQAEGATKGDTPP